MTDDEELAEKITRAVTEVAGSFLAPLTSYEADALYEDTREAVDLAIAQHRAPLGR